MTKKSLMAVGLLMLLWIGCAPKQTIKPSEQAATPAATEESKKEPSIRFADWEGTTELKNVYFAFDSSDLMDAARSQLKKNKEYLAAHTEFNILIEGYCDERGTVEYNLALGQRRAAVVREYYGRLGIPLARIGTISYGKENPEDPAHNEAAWAKNRRVTTKVRTAQ